MARDARTLVDKPVDKTWTAKAGENGSVVDTQVKVLWYAKFADGIKSLIDDMNLTASSWQGGPTATGAMLALWCTAGDHLSDTMGRMLECVLNDCMGVGDSRTFNVRHFPINSTATGDS